LKPLILLPAVDVREGQAVRLIQGELKNQTNYGSPLDAALDFQSAGAEWIHLVDLDAAFGTGSNFELLAEVIGKLDIKVQLSGGIRDEETLQRALSTGCERINLGTAALENLAWISTVISRFGDQIAVALDVRGHTLAARGWNRDGGDLLETLSKLNREGCARYVVTDVNKDGTLQGPNLNLLREVCSATDSPVIASGGVSTLEDLITLRAMTELGVEGAIVGKALYSGAFNLQDALSATREAARQ
jgi:phosphoribosyl isomerase A